LARGRELLNDAGGNPANALIGSSILEHSHDTDADHAHCLDQVVDLSRVGAHCT
jgi:hypothetical protein